MIYELALLVLVAVTLCKKASRPFACVLAAVWLIDASIGRIGIAVGEPRLLALIGVIDSIGATALLILTLDRPKWWAWTCFALAACALPVHVWFWSFWLSGVSYAETYTTVQNTLFLLSIAVLVVGSYDIVQRASRVLDWSGNHRLSHGDAYGRVLRHGDPRSEKASKGEVRPHGR